MTALDFVAPHSTPTLDAWAEMCWPVLAIRPRTLREYQARYRRNLAPEFGCKPLDLISRLDVQRWLLAQRPTIGENVLPVLKTLYREANAYGMASTNPTVGVKKRPHIKARRDFVTWDVLNGMDFGRYNNLIRFLAMHGLRWSECRALTEVDVHDQYVWVTKSAEGLPTKSGRERRVPYVGYFEDFPRSYKWARLALQREAGVTIHSLRKTYAYTLKRAGVHPQVAQQLLGHASIVLTMDLYTDVLPDELDAVGVTLRGAL